MFDLLGVMIFSSQTSEISLSELSLPGSRWADTTSVHRSVSGQQFRAVYLERLSDVQSYSSEAELHLLIVGEAFARNQSLDGRAPVVGPLKADEILKLFKRDSTRFIQSLKGNFTLIIIDEGQNKCIVYNSLFGISPFYYAYDGDQFIFSTSLAAVASCLSSEPIIDQAAVAELALFNYPLGDRTYFRKVKMLRPAEKIVTNANGVRSERYWDVRTLYDVKLLPESDALEIGASLFHKTVNNLSADMPRIRVSFTSGFDSRAILSVLEKEPNDYLSYSFGIPGSLNITIPQQIAQQLGFSYESVILDGDYETVFDEYALRALMLSDCLSTVERANYPYAFERLANFSPVVITGLFGSELLRTFQNVGHIVSANLVRMNLASDPIAELRQIIASPLATGYFKEEVFRQAAEEVEADVSSAIIPQFGDMPSDQRFYMFLLTEGLRKYFGAEVHMERPWGINRFPYLDDEFVEFAFSAPFAGVHSRTLRPSIMNRFNSQYFYSYVIQKYRPELLNYQTDHGYSPRDLVSRFALLRIGPKFLYWRNQRRRIGYREFKTEEWTEGLYKRHLFAKPMGDDLFSRKMKEDFQNGKWKTSRLEFAKAASLKLWLEELNLI